MGSVERMKKKNSSKILLSLRKPGLVVIKELEVGNLVAWGLRAWQICLIREKG